VYGVFLGCDKYPKCKYVEQLGDKKENKSNDKEEEKD